MLVLLLIGAPVSCASHFFYRMAYPDVAINVERCSDLPPGASRISYCRSPLRGQYRFAIGEADFLAWIAEKRFRNLGFKQDDGRYLQYEERNLRVSMPGEAHEYLVFNEQRISLVRHAGGAREVIWEHPITGSHVFSAHDVDGGGYDVVWVRAAGVAYWSWSAN